MKFHYVRPPLDFIFKGGGISQQNHCVLLIFSFAKQTQGYFTPVG